jgi:hypothetical protein
MNAGAVLASELSKFNCARGSTTPYALGLVKVAELKKMTHEDWREKTHAAKHHPSRASYTLCALLTRGGQVRLRSRTESRVPIACCASLRATQRPYAPSGRRSGGGGPGRGGGMRGRLGGRGGTRIYSAGT